jgi:hypothetical protein
MRASVFLLNPNPNLNHNLNLFPFSPSAFNFRFCIFNCRDSRPAGGHCFVNAVTPPTIASVCDRRKPPPQRNHGCSDLAIFFKTITRDYAVGGRFSSRLIPLKLPLIPTSDRIRPLESRTGILPVSTPLTGNNCRLGMSLVPIPHSEFPTEFPTEFPKPR